jgi:dsRNA-specific ribonuclease
MSIPPLPPVQSDAALTIFVHSSLKSTVQNERFGDVERLAFIGHQILSMAIAESFFEKRPMLTAMDLQVKCSGLPLMFRLCT